MQETQTEEEGMSETRPTGEKDISETPDASHESLWGAVLFAGMLIFVVASVCGVGWAVYTKWHSERVAKSQPSITVLSEQASKEKNVAPTEPAVVSTKAVEPAANDSVVAAKKLEISVLNGGGAKGSAGTLAAFLKNEGYSKTVTGNTLSNYTGVTLYYAVGLDKEGAAVMESVAKKYPQAKILPADTKNKETIVSQITIILGK